MNIEILKSQGKVFFTSDWHAGEVPERMKIPFEATHSFLRPKRTDVLVAEWMEECTQKISPEDTLIFLGDLAIQLEDLAIYMQLPKCRKILIMGDKEYANKNFSREEFLAKNQELGLFDEVYEEVILILPQEDQKISWYLAHKPEDSLKQELPSLCGHVHGVWRTQAMPNGNPIINVGVDAWGALVELKHLQHQYNAVTKGYYDRNCKVLSW